MDRPVWVAGSTHAGEEDVLLAAHRLVRARFAQALLVLVPRHPPRFEEVADWLKARGVNFVTRSSASGTNGETEVFLVNTLGELLSFYAAGDVAFVGGTLVPIGGHNLLEPAALGLPVLAGPNNFNSADIARLLAEGGAVRIVHDAQELAAAIVRVARRSGHTHPHGCQRPAGHRGEPRSRGSPDGFPRAVTALAIAAAGPGVATGCAFGSTVGGFAGGGGVSSQPFMSSSALRSRMPAACLRRSTFSM